MGVFSRQTAQNLELWDGRTGLSIALLSPPRLKSYLRHRFPMVLPSGHPPYLYGRAPHCIFWHAVLPACLSSTALDFRVSLMFIQLSNPRIHRIHRADRWLGLPKVVYLFISLLTRFSWLEPLLPCTKVESRPSFYSKIPAVTSSSMDSHNQGPHAGSNKEAGEKSKGLNSLEKYSEAISNDGDSARAWVLGCPSTRREVYREARLIRERSQRRGYSRLAGS